MGDNGESIPLVARNNLIVHVRRMNKGERIHHIKSSEKKVAAASEEMG